MKNSFIKSAAFVMLAVIIFFPAPQALADGIFSLFNGGKVITIVLPNDVPGGVEYRYRGEENAPGFQEFAEAIVSFMKTKAFMDEAFVNAKYSKLMKPYVIDTGVTKMEKMGIPPTIHHELGHPRLHPDGSMEMELVFTIPFLVDKPDLPPEKWDFLFSCRIRHYLFPGGKNGAIKVVEWGFYSGYTQSEKGRRALVQALQHVLKESTS